MRLHNGVYVLEFFMILLFSLKYVYLLNIGMRLKNKHIYNNYLIVA